MIGIFMNECIDSTMGRNPRMLAVLLASDDPRTSWSFQLVGPAVGSCSEEGSPGRQTLATVNRGNSCPDLASSSDADAAAETQAS